MSLAKHHLYSCGTARSNRKGFPAELKQVKLQRCEHVSKLTENSTVQCLVWKDKDVYFINTISDPADKAQVKRKNKDGTQSLVDCPTAVKQYNTCMGGVDLADFKRKIYSCSRKSAKWWHRLFYYCVDVCIVNAHILQGLSPHQQCMKQKEFRLELARELMSCHNSRKCKKRGRRTFEGAPSITLNEQHYPDKIQKPLQCRVCSSTNERKRTSYGCSACNSSNPVPLCIVPCFRIYHQK